MLRWTVGFLLISYATPSFATGFNLAKLVRETNSEASSTRVSGIQFIYSPIPSADYVSAGNLFGIGYQTKFNLSDAVGVSLGFSLENMEWTSNSSLTFVNFDPNFTLSAFDNIYVLGGPNVAIPTVDQVSYTKVASNWGYQVGVGAKISREWTIEGLYRDIRFKAARMALNLDNFNSSAVMIRGIYRME